MIPHALIGTSVRRAAPSASRGVTAHRRASRAVGGRCGCWQRVGWLAMRFAAGYGAEMIVWLASFPRSGNTFLRIVLHRLYGVRTSTVYDVDGVAERLGKDLIGFTDRLESLS